MRRRHALLAAAPLAAAGLVGGVLTAGADTTPQGTVSSTLQKITGSSGTSTTSGATSTSVGGVSGTAHAEVLSITPRQTCVSCTSASAGPGGASSQATTLEVFGQSIAGGHSNSSGAVLALPSNPLIDLALLDWAAKSQATGTSSSSSSRSAVADVALGGGQVATVAVLESDSHANWTTNGTTSTAKGSSENNGAVVNLGQGALVIVLLHSDASSSSHSGSAYVASINGNQILSSSQTGGIPITIPGVATITLLNAGTAGGTVNSDVGTVSNLGGQPGTQATALGSSGSGANSGVEGLSTTSPSTSGNGPSHGSTAAASSGPHIPFTGAGLGLAGFLLLGAGGGSFGVAQWLRRRRREDEATA